MRERITKFILMAAAVILIGTGVTMFNWKGWGAGRSSNQSGVSMAADREDNAAVRVLEETEPERARETATQPISENAPRERADAAGGEEDDVVSAQCDRGDGEEGQEIDFLLQQEAEAVALTSEDSTKQKNPEGSYEESKLVMEEVQKESSEESVVILESFANWEDARDAYYSRLSEMDKKLTAKAEESYKKPIADQKTIADEIWKFWDDELNAIYQELRRSLTQEEFDALREEERAWLRNRDELASKAAAAENSSSSSQNLAYTRSLAESTKSRVYELAEMFYSYCQTETK